MPTQTQNIWIVEDIIDAIRTRLEPSDVFDDETLGKWAEENGYVKEVS